MLWAVTTGGKTQSGADERQLRATVEALRAELERTEVEKAEAVQTAVRDAHDEIAQLQAAVVALRQELEDQRVASEDATAATQRAFRDERDQLTGMVAALRDQLEAKDG